MLFPTFAFGVFFAVVLPVSWMLRARPTAWRLFVLGASCIFYAYWDARFVLLLLGSIVVNWVFSKAIWEAGRRGEGDSTGRHLIRAAVVVNLAVLGVFKYYDFFVVSFANLLGSVGISVGTPTLSVVLPVGISFFTFQAMSYVIAVHRRDIRPMRLLDFAVSLAFFPQLVAGPIVRASEFAPQLARGVDPRRVEVPTGIRLILVGLFKKVVISSYLASELVDPAFALPDQHSGWELLLAAYAYGIQIYADFSGYTDIAIGCALLMGIRFPKNFDSPYAAGSIQDFWRRWHMTLSRWLRDYLYIPLGGNRDGEAGTYRNIMITMLLGGLWHGAAWTFVAWGAIHGVAMVAERALASRWQALGAPPIVTRPLRWLLTFNIVCLAWIFFRAPSFEIAWTILGRIVSAAPGDGTVPALLVAVVVVAVLAQFVPSVVSRRIDEYVVRLPPVAIALMIAVSLTVIDALGPEGVAPFIYFQF